MSAEAVAKRRQEEMRALQKGKMRKKNLAKELGAGEGPVGILRLFVSETARKPNEILDEIKRLTLAYNLDEKKKMSTALDALCKYDDIPIFVETLTAV